MTETDSAGNAMRLVLIEWVDSFGCSTDWTPLEGNAPEVLVCRSVGWLLHDGDDCKTIVPHISSEHPGAERQGCGDMTIPNSAVVRIVELEEL